MVKKDKWLPAKFAAYCTVAVGSLFVGAWAGPIGLVYWSVWTTIALWLFGLTWDNLKVCFILSLGLALLVYWVKNPSRGPFPHGLPPDEDRR